MGFLTDDVRDTAEMNRERTVTPRPTETVAAGRADGTRDPRFRAHPTCRPSVCHSVLGDETSCHGVGDG